MSKAKFLIESVGKKKLENLTLDIFDPTNLVNPGRTIAGILTLGSDFSINDFEALEDMTDVPDIRKDTLAAENVADEIEPVMAEIEPEKKEEVITISKIAIKELYENKKLNITSKLKNQGTLYAVAYNRNVKTILGDNEDEVIDELTKAVRSIFEDARQNPVCEAPHQLPRKGGAASGSSHLKLN